MRHTFYGICENSDATFVKFEAQFHKPLPESFRTFYAVHDGQRSQSPLCLFHGLRGHGFPPAFTKQRLLLASWRPGAAKCFENQRYRLSRFAFPAGASGDSIGHHLPDRVGSLHALLGGPSVNLSKQLAR
jgi:hypothetical protein